MAEITVEVDATEVLAMLEQLGPAADAHVNEASRISALNIQQEARSRARRATGLLIESIEVEQAEPPLGGYRVFVAEMTDARGRRAEEFALWHEEGTKYMDEQPFIGPAVELEEGAHLRRVAEALQDAIDEVNS